MQPSIRYRFDELTLDTGRRQLSRGTEAIALSKLSFRLLCALVEAAPNVVTHDDLAAQVWDPRRIVTPENLAKRVMLLRRALGDRARAPRYIAGVRGVGYRLLSEVCVGAEEPGARGGGAERGSVHGMAVRYLAAGLMLAFMGFIAAVFWRQHEPGRDGEPSAPAAVLPAESPAPFEATSVRINVELVDADTEHLIWTDSYEGELSSEDVLGIQSEIAISIAQGLRRASPRDEPARVGPGYSVVMGYSALM